jgi:hypothetical protein
VTVSTGVANPSLNFATVVRAGGVRAASQKAARRPPRGKKKRFTSQPTTFADTTSTFPIRLEPGDYLVYTVQFTISQDSLDVNEAITVAPVVTAKGPLNLNALTAQQIVPDNWSITALQKHSLDITLAPLQLGDNPTQPLAGELCFVLMLPSRKCSRQLALVTVTLPRQL